MAVSAFLAVSLAGCGGTEDASSQPESSVAESSAPESSALESASSSAESSSAATGDASYSVGLDENGYFEGIKALDYVELPDFAGIEVPADTLEISDSSVQEQADALFSAYNEETQVTDRAVVDGDTVNIDYVGSIDGVEFEGGNTQGNGATVTIGVTNYIDDFLEQLIGHKAGETFDVNVTFPEDYGQEDLNGKDAVFKTTVNYIVEKAYGELNDQFVSEKLKEEYGWSTVDEMKAGLKEQLRQDAAGGYLLEQIIGQAKISEIPQQIQEYHKKSLKAYYETIAQQSGYTLEEYLEQMGISSEEALVEENKDALETNAKTSLVRQALCEQLKVSVSQEDVMEFLKQMLNASEDQYPQIEERYGAPYLWMLTREWKVKLQLGSQAVQ